MSTNHVELFFPSQDSPAPKVPTVETDKREKLASPKAPQTPSATPAKVMHIELISFITLESVWLLPPSSEFKLVT